MAHVPIGDALSRAAGCAACTTGAALASAAGCWACATGRASERCGEGALSIRKQTTSNNRATRGIARSPSKMAAWKEAQHPISMHQERYGKGFAYVCRRQVI